MSDHRLEVADVLRTYGDDFLAQWGHVLSREQRKAFEDIRVCRTAALGGHVEQAISARIAPSHITGALWGVFSNGEWTGKRACCTRPHALSTLHYGLPFSSSSSLSGGRNLPLRKLGGTTASMASSFSVGSART